VHGERARPSRLRRAARPRHNPARSLAPVQCARAWVAGTDTVPHQPGGLAATEGCAPRACSGTLFPAARCSTRRVREKASRDGNAGRAAPTHTRAPLTWITPLCRDARIHGLREEGMHATCGRVRGKECRAHGRSAHCVRKQGAPRTQRHTAPCPLTAWGGRTDPSPGCSWSQTWSVGEGGRNVGQEGVNFFLLAGRRKWASIARAEKQQPVAPRNAPAWWLANPTRGEGRAQAHRHARVRMRPEARRGGDHAARASDRRKEGE
jgi:hypothetical protein